VISVRGCTDLPLLAGSGNLNRRPQNLPNPSVKLASAPAQFLDWAMLC
jgi:hypothetical protein